LRTWLEQQPAAHIIVLCDRFGGRKLRYVFDQILGADHASQVQILCLPERSCNENDWWHYRQGIVEVFDAFVNLAYTRLAGEDCEEWREWDPAEYQQKLREQLGNP
jgi:hypothetical protein